jgi:tellurite resistance protein TerC
VTPVLAAARYVDLDVPAWAWLALVATIVGLLLADLLVVHRRPHAVTFRAAAIESGVWIALGLGFAVLLGVVAGGAAAGEYLSGYLIEKSLSIDNVFVWAVIFTAAGVPDRYQFRVLFWGVFGALALRAGFVLAGVTLLETFEWILYVFGAFLLVTAYRMARHRATEIRPERNPVLRAVRRVVPSTDEYDGQRLFTRRTGRWLATPLLAVLVLVESTDVLFAVDSIPAILGVSREPFLVFAANAFAILGLRALYFCLAGMTRRFRYLDRGLAVVLGFVGVKMLLVEVVHLPTPVSLGVIAVVMAVAIAASLRADQRSPDTDLPDTELPEPIRRLSHGTLHHP